MDSNRRDNVRESIFVQMQYALQGDASGDKYECIAVDISKSGLGIISDYPLEYGQVLSFNNENNRPFANNALVRWNTLFGDKYRSGLSFF